MGIPIDSNPRRIKTWSPIIDKFKSKLALWRGGYLSFVDKIILVKSIFTRLPIFFFSFYKALVKVCRDIDKFRQRFPWGGTNVKSKIHWVRWDNVCKSKEFDGHGSIKYKLREGVYVPFWFANWCNVLPLASSFSDLFASSNCKGAFLVNIGAWHNDVWIWGNFGIPFLLQNSVMDIILCLKKLMSGFVLAACVKSLTQWSNVENAVYIARDYYQSITGTKIQGSLETERH
ncbi:hypothetical protein KIW84_063337 [Lathyrus oleraceus]|uniref:Uncharacterized protein n=1 Tax=Pisum sativum TaxID=3888 RepID=A0A9D4W8P5_PEA|nr:hypothetical protein KIW84_063337 [Pisum sativum]